MQKHLIECRVGSDIEKIKRLHVPILLKRKGVRMKIVYGHGRSFENCPTYMNTSRKMYTAPL